MERELARLVDQADLLTSQEEALLLETLDEISERQACDIVVVTADGLGGKSPRAYADDFFDYNGYGMGRTNDGVLLLVSMEERDWYVSTSGFGEIAIGENELEYMSEEFVPYLSEGNYLEAFETYAKWCDRFVTEALTGKAAVKETVSPIWIPGSLLIGFLLALIPVNIMKGKLKSVHRAAAAGNYVREGSFALTERKDLFLYRNVSRMAKPKDDGPKGGGGHTSSSGARHGGGGGKF